MSDTKWTPGPWLLGKEYDCHTNIESSDGSRIGKTDCLSDKNRQPYNARLIAAAPELYEALEALMSDNLHSFPVGATEKARAALAKARGEA